MRRALILGVFLLGGCAARKPVTHGEVVIPNDCITDLKLTEKSRCHGPDGAHIKCEDVTITRQAGCERFEVSEKRGKTK